ncbi:hypothetical protein [Parapedobacter sp. 10938]|uniref:hypothetical protein n=1 Tax=Parapedobacter flavus TaxID=3110225 RepID=UPI002DB8242E|nr:hypothetical protein [Parapedobacter sp. 10938]MEC3878581.1 hypothetical protein [Parapedobacter sp. 10938]
MRAAKKKLDKKNIAKAIEEAEKQVKAKKVSRTWLAFLKAVENPGEISDMKAVLK